MTQPLPTATRRAIVARYTNQRDPQSIRRIAADLTLTFWKVRSVLLAEGVELRNRGGSRRRRGGATK